jgi:16S rRNA (guanine1207-N2)-methyltransferase
MLRCHLRGNDFEFLTSSGIFSHRRIDPGTRLLIESMTLPDTGAALDLGCGYGPIGVVAATLRPRLKVWMTDINQRAVTLAKRNASRNGVENIRVTGGLLYEPVEGLTFDVILTNPPISAGIRKTVKPVIEGATRYLRPGGSLQLVVRTTKGGRNLSILLEKNFGDFEVVARRSGYRVMKAEWR